MKDERFGEIDSLVTDWLHKEHIKNHPDDADCDEFPFEPASLMADPQLVQRAAKEMRISIDELEEWFELDQAQIDEEDFLNADLDEEEIDDWDFSEDDRVD